MRASAPPLPHERRETGIEPVLFVLLAGAWGSSYLFIKIGVETLPVFSLVTWRLVFGTAFLVAAVLAMRVPLPRDPRTIGRLAVLSVINIVVPFTLITWAEQSIDSGLASILNATTPFFTLLLSVLVLHDRMTGVRLAGLVVGFVGVVVISSGSLGGPEALGEVTGIVAVVLSSVAYALGNIFFARQVRGRVDPTAAALGQVGLALPMLVALGLAVDGGITLPAAPQALFAVAWLGIVGSGIAYLFFFRLLAVWAPTRVTLVTYLMQVVAVGLGVAVLGEPLTLGFVAGAILVVAGIAMVNLRSVPWRRGAAATEPDVPEPEVAVPEP
ncbi:MAG: DMT family transporter [Chloroflexi bacterium]|jgi:drug/metabolite transporter (DMT)-like permease|nr:DMT family transporter [Chloroflexota bacterium]